MYVLSDSIIIPNALYAKETDFLKYEEIDEYKKQLYKMITKKHKYIMFKSSESKTLEVDDHIFIKEKDGVSCMDPIDEEFIKELNSIYPEDIRTIIKSTHSKEKQKIKQNTTNKKYPQ